jgi:hypothetical protein
LDDFVKTFVADPGAPASLAAWREDDTKRLVGMNAALYTYFVRRVARQSYGNGLLRFLLPGVPPGLIEWNSAGGWKDDWRRWAGRLCVFAYDWLGRQIAFDRARTLEGEPAIAILEPGTGELLEVPETFGSFLEREIIQYGDAALATSFFEQWCAQRGAAPAAHQCVGYIKPLFLGGEDAVGNLELIDMAVYVSTCGQLFAQVADLPPGTPIQSVTRRGD